MEVYIGLLFFFVVWLDFQVLVLLLGLILSQGEKWLKEL